MSYLLVNFIAVHAGPKSSSWLWGAKSLGIVLGLPVGSLRGLGREFGLGNLSVLENVERLENGDIGLADDAIVVVGGFALSSNGSCLSLVWFRVCVVSFLVVSQFLPLPPLVSTPYSGVAVEDLHLLLRKGNVKLSQLKWRC